jgi:outer membrane protein assembly factor BamA
VSARGSLLSIAAAFAAVATATTAHATDALNSSEKSGTGSKVIYGDEAAEKTEFNLLPVGGGTTDIGVGGGFFANYAVVKAGYDPYIWEIESAGLVTLKYADGQVVFPYQDVYVKLTIPRLFGLPLRFEVRPEYSWETTLGYYGLGNASSATAPQGAPSKYFQYGRLHPELVADLRWRILDHVGGRAGLTYTENWNQVASNSKLANDLQNGSPEVKSLLGSTDQSGVIAATAGIQWDNRDNEVSTHSGSYDTVDIRFSPGGGGHFPYRYEQATAIGRFFVPLGTPRVVFAARVVADLLYGSPPFYELSRFNNGYMTYALGSQDGVRGIPGQRYYGKVKAFGNFEVRSELANFQLLGKPMVFGAVAFFDGGRVWADTTPQPALDGTGLGLKYGIGGGLRLQSGSAFVLRGDIAWSPDATPIGAYFAVGQLF